MARVLGIDKINNLDKSYHLPNLYKILVNTLWIQHQTFTKKMKLILCIVFISLTSAKLHYHEAIGVPRATQIKKTESLWSPIRIINGNQVSLGQYPYFGGLIITLSSNATSVCGSTLISITKLITAAHCWYDGSIQAERFEVVLGSTTLFSGGTRIVTSQVTVHEEYNASSVHNDIAIITITQVSESVYIHPIKLKGNKKYFEGIVAEVVGFGRTSDEEGVNINQYLRSTQVTVIGYQLCELLYGHLFTQSMICTDGIHSSPCRGDSGGPLLYRDEVSEAIFIGVVSYGSSFGCEVGHPAVYTKIPDFLQWIETNLYSILIQ